MLQSPNPSLRWSFNSLLLMMSWHASGTVTFPRSSNQSPRRSQKKSGQRELTAPPTGEGNMCVCESAELTITLLLRWVALLTWVLLLRWVALLLGWALLVSFLLLAVLGITLMGLGGGRNTVWAKQAGRINFFFFLLSFYKNIEFSLRAGAF